MEMSNITKIFVLIVLFLLGYAIGIFVVSEPVSIPNLHTRNWFAVLEAESASQCSEEIARSIHQEYLKIWQEPP